MKALSVHRIMFRLSLVAVVAMSAVFSLQAQAPSSSDVPPPTIRVSTHLVLVDVVVTDKQGKPITGLKAEDFTVQEKGKTQKIAVFTPPEALQNHSAPGELAPGIYTNRPEFRATGPVTILMIDANNTPFRDQAYARTQMLQYVKQQMTPGERVGVFALANSLYVLQDFTTDPKILIAALEKYKPSEPILGAAQQSSLSATTGAELGAGAAAQASLVQSQISSFASLQVGYVLERRTEVTLGAMRSLARILQGIPGRKTVVWLSAGFPFELIPEDRNISEAELEDSIPSVNQHGVGTHSGGSLAATQRGLHAEEIRQVAAQLSSAQVAIYPVDVRGLMSGMEFLPEDAGSSGAVDSSGRAIARMSDAAASQETMRDIAAETGGRAYVNQNEIKEAVVLAVQDNAASYTLGYYPEDKKWDNKYRTIKVKVGRDGVQTRYRQGYFAIDPSQIKNRKPEQEVAEALNDSVPDTQVTFSAKVTTATKGKVGVDFLVDPRTLSAEDASGGKKLDVAFYAAIFSPDGKMLGNSSQKVDQAFKEETYQQILQHGMLLHIDMDAPAGKNQLRIAVRDNRTGHVGTLEAPLSQ